MGPLVSDWISVYRSPNIRDDYLRWLNAIRVGARLLPKQLLDLDPNETHPHLSVNFGRDTIFHFLRLTFLVYSFTKLGTFA